MTNRIATICARGGSKGLPGKNLLPFPDADGKPLIVHSIEQALRCPLIDGVYVSTDDPQIAQVARGAGAVVPSLRPAELATDDAPKLPVIEHLVQQVEAMGRLVDEVVDLQPTSPLRTPQDLLLCIRSLDEADGAAELVITGSDCGFNPWFNMVVETRDGLATLAAAAGNWTVVARRQDAPKVLGMNGSIYVWRRAALAHASLHGMWSVRVKAIEMPRERSVDIDDAFDFEMAAWLARWAGAERP